MPAAALRREMGRLLGPEWLLPIVLGVADGILNALTLASASLIGADGGIGFGLALRVSAAAFATAAFVFFVAQYAEYRGELVTAARHLSLHSSRRLVRTQLGRTIARDALLGTAATGCSSFPGALLPLLAAVAVPSHPWIAVPIAIALLAALGVAVAVAIDGQPLRWALVLAAGGVVMTGVGYELKIA